MKSSHLLIALPLVVLSGCATQVVSSDPHQVIVESQAMDMAQAQKLAAAECSKHKRFARLSVKADFYDRNYVFDCID